ncbi:MULTISPECIES: DUF4363 family protein [unclassified Candidatus Frackibacter]|uniref:DUF4363 family protein n=1 Tax=unclassified Candidatus Frackibacter TaxID=2648818 RepID=UPI0007986079|nr:MULTISPECIES: DUF4363 family protein [unclassified Candidatus Frackibacter]KXS43421.1 MAG: hypothetical protein AWU54_1043 [Candidatus Frackibacter sp. T328-2]
MRNITGYMVPVIILIIFAVLMLSISYLKQPLAKSDDMMQYVKLIKSDIKAKKWNQADENFKRLKEAWKKVRSRIQFAASNGEIEDLSNNLARLEGAIEAKDKLSSLIELSETKNHWKSLGK